MKKILFVLSSLNLGGTEVFILNIIKRIYLNYKIDVFINRDESFFFENELSNLGIRIFKTKKLNMKNLNNHILYFNQILKENSYDIVHANLNELSGLYLKQAKNQNVSLRIAHSHSTGKSDRFFKKFLKNRFKKMTIKYSNCYLACSQEAGYYLFGKNFSSQGRVVYNGVDYNRFIFNVENRNKIRTKYNIDDETILLGHVGNFRVAKNHEFMINIMERLNSNKFKLMFIGSGELESKIKNLAVSKNLENRVLFLGERENVEEFYSAFDLFLYPSFYEGFGISLIEAQANGLKCLVSETIPHIIDFNKSLIEYKTISNVDFWVEYINSYVKYDRKIDLTSKVFDYENIVACLNQIYSEK